MMDPTGAVIRLLPDQLANQIAAGEVVQRPSSVVKELLENSVDAGASFVRLSLREAGKTLIQVSDDGSGMSELDARMSFERHATSKISSSEDLFRLKTFGFRGEALASIAAVAEVEMRTCREAEPEGTRLLISGGDVRIQEPVACPKGTTISVKNLFFNVPARKVFLKSNPVELRHIDDEFQRVALINPEVGFSMEHNGVEMYHLRPENLKQRIVNLLGNAQIENLVPIHEDTSIVRVSGFIGKPSMARKTRGQQFFFANGRYIRDNYLNHAVMKAYQELLPEGQYPLYVIVLELDPSRIDVNVHPTKSEIKFDDEKSIYAILFSAVKKSLSQFQLTPSLDFEAEPLFNRMAPEGQAFQARSAWQTSSSTPANAGFSKLSQTTPSDSGRFSAWDQHYQSALDKADKNVAQAIQSRISIPEDEKQEEPGDKQLFQLHQRYIVAQIKSGMILIDQKAALERIRYEKLRKQLADQPASIQKSLFPETLELPLGEAAMLRDMIPDLARLGFDIAEFGNNAFLVQGFPAETEPFQSVQLLEEMLEEYRHFAHELKLNPKESLVRSLARLEAAKTKSQLEKAEMQRLIDQLFACETPNFSPDGKQTILTLSLSEIEERLRARS